MSDDNLETSPRKIVFAEEAGSRPNRFVGKADDAEQEPGKCTQWDPPGYGLRHLRKDSQR